MNWIQRFLTAITTHKGDASAHHTKTSKASEITSEQFPVDRMPRAASGFLEGKGAGVNPAYSALIEADIPAHMAKSKLAFTANKLLKGAGPGADPTEVDSPEVHGADKHTNVTRELFILATTGSTTGVAADLGYFPCIELADGVTNFIRVAFKVPDDFVSLSSLKAVWSAGVAAGNMRWSLNALYGAEGEVYNAHTDNPAYGETATGGINRLNIQEPANPLTLALLAIGDYVGIRMGRNAGHANDTIDDDVCVLGFLFTYVGEQ